MTNANITVMKELENIYFKNREAFRNWLEDNHDKSHGIWMIFYKKHTKVECIKYIDALEEAICFGWIDSIIKKADSDSYLRKFTPRTNTANWSDVNKKLVLMLINKGKMTEAGLRKIDAHMKLGEINQDFKNSKEDKKKNELQVPDFILKEFAKNEPALTNFNNLAQSYKRNFILWITIAKRTDTISNRLKESIELLKENKKLGLK